MVGIEDERLILMLRYFSICFHIPLSNRYVSTNGHLYCVFSPTIYVLSKNKRKYLNFLSENYHFYSREKLQYITWACFRNELPSSTGTYFLDRHTEDTSRTETFFIALISFICTYILIYVKKFPRPRYMAFITETSPYKSDPRFPPNI